MTSIKQITLAMSGASGMPYGFRLLERLIASGHEVNLLISQAAHVVIALETNYKLSSQTEKLQFQLRDLFHAKENQLRVYGKDQWTAGIASGSSMVDAMVICPCSSGCLAAIATGMSNNLLERAADVMIKERRPLIIVPRETPLSTIHLQHMLQLSQMGATILPPAPGFYHQPKTIDDLVDFIVARILDHLAIPQDLVPRWGEPPGDR